MKTDTPFGEAQAVKFHDENVRLDRSIQAALDASRVASSDAKAFAAWGGAGRTCPVPVDLLVNLCELLKETLDTLGGALRGLRAKNEMLQHLFRQGDRLERLIDDQDRLIDEAGGDVESANDLFLRIVEFALKTPHDDLTAPLRALREDMQARGVHLDDAP